MTNSITLDKLKELSNSRQDLFDFISEHLVNQGEQAAGSTDKQNWTCRYKIEKDGKTLKCAVGCLIPDSCYSDQFEGDGARELIDFFAGFGKEEAVLLRGILRDNIKMLVDFQFLHDSKDWIDGHFCKRHLREKLSYIAEKHYMETDFLDSLFQSEKNKQISNHDL